jgi:cytochrome P450
MGKAMYREHAIFRESADATAAVVERLFGWSPLAMFRGDGNEVSEAELATWRRSEIVRVGMIQIALTDMWCAMGIRPAGVIGISLGEMVAPYAAGALSRDDSIAAVAAIAHAASRRPGEHVMLFVRADGDAARRLARSAPIPLDHLGSVIPGTAIMLCRKRDLDDARSWLGELLEKEQPSDWSFHTPGLGMDRAWLAERLRNIRPLPPHCPIYSAAAGGRIPAGDPFDADFFGWMASRPFHFSDAMSAALRDGFDTVLGIGSYSVAESVHAQGRKVRVIDALRQDGEERSWRQAVAALRPLDIAPPRPRPVDASTLRLGERDNFETFEELRRGGPVHYLPRHDFWLLLGHEEVRQALADTGAFSSDMPDLREIDPVLLGSDPPGHNALRRRVARHFTSQAVARRARLAETEAERLLQPLAEGRELEIVQDLAIPLAVEIAADLVGLIASDARELNAAAAAAATSDVKDFYARMAGTVEALAARSSLYAELLRDGFDEASARSLIRLFWISGMTPAHAIAPAVVLLLRHDDVRRELKDDMSRLPTFVDEVLRLNPPAHLIPRLAKREIRIGGKRIPAGALVQLSLAAANRDPARFADPSTLRMDRSPNQHLSFGTGIHRCIAAAHGRAFVTAGLSALFRTAPDFRAVQPLATVRTLTGTTLREIEQLVIGA